MGIVEKLWVICNILLSIKFRGNGLWSMKLHDASRWCCLIFLAWQWTCKIVGIFAAVLSMTIMYKLQLSYIDHHTKKSSA